MKKNNQEQMNDEALTDRAILESTREKVSFAYRLIMIRQHEHEERGQFQLAQECAAIRYCLEIAAKKIQQEGKNEI